jgi:hypothetical protein
VFSLPMCYRLSASPMPPTCLLLTVSEARSYFASTVRFSLFIVQEMTFCNRTLMAADEHNVVGQYLGA